MPAQPVLATALRTVGRLLAAVAVLVTAVLSSGVGSASADTALGHLVFVVKDQAGGAYYNVTTGERYALVAASAVPTLAIAGVQTADGVVLTVDGQLYEPLDKAVDGTPLADVVTVAQTSGTGTYVDAATGAQYVLTEERDAVPAANIYALRLATGAILTVNADVLLPVQAATGT